MLKIAAVKLNIPVYLHEFIDAETTLNPDFLNKSKLEFQKFVICFVMFLIKFQEHCMYRRDSQSLML